MTKTPSIQSDAASAALTQVLTIVGSRAELARRLGISRAAVTQWKRVPLNRVAAIARLTGLPIEQLAPEFVGDVGGATPDHVQRPGPFSPGVDPPVVRPSPDGAQTSAGLPKAGAP